MRAVPPKKGSYQYPVIYIYTFQHAVDNSVCLQPVNSIRTDRNRERYRAQKLNTAPLSTQPNRKYATLLLDLDLHKLILFSLLPA